MMNFLRNAALTALLAAGTSAGAASYIGLYSPLIGVQYQQDLDPQSALRFGAGLPLGSVGGESSSFLLSGDAAYLYRLTAGTSSYVPYLGAGLGLTAFTGTNTTLIFNAGVLLGLEYHFTDRLNTAYEFGFGPAWSPESPTVLFAPSFRVGLNYRL
ncbi:hypothetical protein [Deinococcus ficus]|uniref:Outer membrane protein beta-barrel domain-containing protein n=1 Tax=Deinococcus ficus TaxID=317577 RepID=A0A221SXX7_9DEIO|nr:hypothetical protein [Deinococcus ficus]ASN81480.1 hypothetical protein DFI_11135 [Deinococcus ficus]